MFEWDHRRRILTPSPLFRLVVLSALLDPNDLHYFSSSGTFGDFCFYIYVLSYYILHSNTTLGSLRKLAQASIGNLHLLRFTGTCSWIFVSQYWNGRYMVDLLSSHDALWVLLHLSQSLRRDAIKVASLHGPAVNSRHPMPVTSRALTSSFI